VVCRQGGLQRRTQGRRIHASSLADTKLDGRRGSVSAAIAQQSVRGKTSVEDTMARDDRAGRRLCEGGHRCGNGLGRARAFCIGLWERDDRNARGWLRTEVEEDVVSVPVELGHDLAMLELNLDGSDTRQLVGEL